mmetsp:Transcript_38492/g.108786  ORF Transcript_38492/g.108786 Transcript_38492/m.108786 type:complete len:979 (-) Transcript_38492:400-3336(-)
MDVVSEHGGGAAVAASRSSRLSKRAKFLNPRFHPAATSSTESLPVSPDTTTEDSGAGPSETPFPAAPPAACQRNWKLPVVVTGGRDAQETVLNSNDMLKILFGSLGMDDLCSAAITNKQWNSISQSDEFWHSISFENRKISRDQILRILQRHQQVHSLNLTGLHCTGPHTEASPEHLLPALAGALPHLTTLELGGGPLSEQQLSTIGRRFPNLRSLRISDSALGRFGPGEVVIAHDNLTRLEVICCRGSRLAVRCNRLQFMSLRGSALPAVSPTCPVLTHLDLKDCSKISDQALRSAILRLPMLTYLDLSTNLPLSDDTLRDAASTCHSLSHLILSNCIAVSLAGVRGFGALRRLNLSNCDSLNSTTAMPVLEAFTALEEVTMDSCGLLTQVVLTLPRLKVLSLRGCRSLERVTLRCRSLTELSLGPVEIGGPGCGALKHISLASDAVTQICWRAFPMLETVALQCPNLVHLDLSDCDSLQDSVFTSISNAQFLNLNESILGMSEDADLPSGSGGASGSAHPYDSSQASVGQCLAERLAMTDITQAKDSTLETGCPRLRTLCLECCEGLQNATLSSTSLSSLSLVGCKGLSKVALDCPALTELHLDECDHVDAVQLANVAVPSMSLGTCPLLTRLVVSAPLLASLDLKGCGLLSDLVLLCPSLSSLDATFCSSLGDDALRTALSRAPPLKELILSVCSSLGPSCVASLGHLRLLSHLDLSYTEVVELEPVVASCPALQTLNLSSCRSLTAGALETLLPRMRRESLAGSSATITALDASYCPLPASALAQVLASSDALECLAISGCAGVTDEVWAGLAASAEAATAAHAMQSLSCVGCKALRTCALGLRRAGEQRHQWEEENGEGAWEPCGAQLSGLVSLRLGLSGVETLALALPFLAHLDVNGCCKLRSLELRCPLLLAGYFQACRGISSRQLQVALQCCDQLEVLDMQHLPTDQAVMRDLRRQCPSLRCLLHTIPVP